MDYIGTTDNTPERLRRSPIDLRYALVPSRVAQRFRIYSGNPSSALSRTIFTGVFLQTEAGIVIVHMERFLRFGQRANLRAKVVVYIVFVRTGTIL